jgi:2-dehydro-3-deoxyphosphogluconate aldolase/(4S)-4-hydroxy-2-oxoglutarate aldolase
MSARPPITPQLLKTRLMAILRSADARHLPAVGRALADAGVTCLEITLTTAGALDALTRLRDELPASVAIGAGTVTTTREAHDAIAAGAEFLVAPVVGEDVIRAAAARDIPCYPGAWTPTEALAAWQAGAAAVKIFPAGTGGPEHLKQLRAPLPAIPLMAVGGVHLGSARYYLDAGACAVGIGSPLLRGADRTATADALSELTAHARRLLTSLTDDASGQEAGS